MAILALMVDGVAVSKFDLPVGETHIGRNTDNAVHIDDLAVSGKHARIKVTPDPYLEGTMRYELEDLGSTNATKLNSHKISSSMLLKDGDTIHIGYNQFKFIDDQVPDFESTAVILPEDRE